MDQELEPYEQGPQEIEVSKPEPKISDVEIILIGVFYLGLDIVDLFPGAGDITDVIAAPMGFYYWMKGLNAITFIVSEIIEAIPGLQEIPFVRIITWGMTIWFDRHPKLEGVLAPVLQAADALGGDIPEGEGSSGISSSSATAQQPRELSDGKTLDMTQAADGTYEYKPGGNSDSTDARPSEAKTERDQTQNKSESEREATERGETNPEQVGVEQGGTADEETPEKTAEERKQAAVNKDYERIMETDAEKEPIEQAKEKLFSEKGPEGISEQEKSLQTEQNQIKESESTRKLRERFAKMQKAKQVEQELTRPKQAQQVTEEDKEAESDQQGNYLQDAA
jgi:hypothetical protein